MSTRASEPVSAAESEPVSEPENAPVSVVAIVGGSGQVGRAVTTELLAAGLTPRVLSRRAAPSGLGAGVEWASVNYKTGEGLTAALSGVVAVLVTVGGMSEPRVVAAVAAACPPDIRIIYLSIVGIDRLPMSYYRVKLAAEDALKSSGASFTILRATQFHSLAWGLLSGLARIPFVLFVPRMRIQPLAVPDVAARLVHLAVDASGAEGVASAEDASGPKGTPVAADPSDMVGSSDPSLASNAPAAPDVPDGYAPELGGPEVFELEQLARRFLQVSGKRRHIKLVGVPGKFGTGLRAGANLTPDHADGTGTFDHYVAGLHH